MGSQGQEWSRITVPREIADQLDDARTTAGLKRGEMIAEALTQAGFTGGGVQARTPGDAPRKDSRLCSPHSWSMVTHTDYESGAVDRVAVCHLCLAEDWPDEDGLRPYLTNEPIADPERVAEILDGLGFRLSE